jgi:phenylpropionate dioxygenase-like ring-hydroxylating dioxygenase large terminal subunit
MGLLIPPPSASVYEAQSLPRDFYIDPDEFEFEKDSIFRQKQLAVTRVDQILNPGDYITYDLLGDEIVITRDEQGRIQAFFNICLHRGCSIVTGRGHVNRN